MGVKVNLVIDAVGSAGTSTQLFRGSVDAGGRVARYHPFGWETLARFNNRTHRVLLVIDGRVGFLGGAGFADQWYQDTLRNPRWRDTIVRVEGKAVASLQATFNENWLESSGEILSGEEYFPFPQERERGTSKRDARRGNGCQQFPFAGTFDTGTHPFSDSACFSPGKHLPYDSLLSSGSQRSGGNATRHARERGVRHQNPDAGQTQ